MAVRLEGGSGTSVSPPPPSLPITEKLMVRAVPAVPEPPASE